MAANRQALLRELDDEQPRYGINTGFGSLARQRIAAVQLEELQLNLIRSHSAGAGPALPGPIVRATMVCLAASLARANSGVRPDLAEAVAAALNAGLIPSVPEMGSVGASGDLAPLAHITLALVGEGQATLNGQEMSAAEALKRAKLKPLRLQAKEGLAMINGTHLMAGRLALLRVGYERLLGAALLATVMTLDAARATDSFLDPRIYAARNQPGATAVAAELRRLIRGSRIVPSHIKDDPRVQDPYSIRCAAVVLGAVVDQLRSVWSALDAELGAVTDNPLVFARRGGVDIVSAGNFHGMPVALPLDLLAIGLAHLAGIAERRVYHLISAFDPESQLKPFLSPKPGLHSGLMITQYTAAACCNELIGLANPASVVNLSTCAGMEDYNSFGPRSAAKAERALDLATTVVAVELLCAAQGIDSHRPLKSSRSVERAVAVIREQVPTLENDRPLAPDIAALRQLISAGAFNSIAKTAALM
jgi:histidine ammonia-lyase